MSSADWRKGMENLFVWIWQLSTSEFLALIATAHAVAFLCGIGAGKAYNLFR